MLSPPSPFAAAIAQVLTRHTQEGDLGLPGPHSLSQSQRVVTHTGSSQAVGLPGPPASDAPVMQPPSPSTLTVLGATDWWSLPHTLMQWWWHTPWQHCTLVKLPENANLSDQYSFIHSTSHHSCQSLTNQLHACAHVIAVLHTAPHHCTRHSTCQSHSDVLVSPLILSCQNVGAAEHTQ